MHPKRHLVEAFEHVRHRDLRQRARARFVDVRVDHQHRLEQFVDRRLRDDLPVFEQHDRLAPVVRDRDILDRNRTFTEQRRQEVSDGIRRGPIDECECFFGVVDLTEKLAQSSSH